MENYKEKIKKLLALSESSNEHGRLNIKKRGARQWKII